MIKIAIAEDSTNLTQVLRQKLSFNKELEVVFDVLNGKDLLDKLAYQTVDLIIMDINMPLMDGIKATQLVKQKYPDIKIVILTIFDSEDKIFDAILAGASGYLLKDDSAENIHNLIDDVMNGGAVMSPTIAFKALEMFKKDQSSTIHQTETEVLSTREIEVLEKLSEGFPYKVVAEKLFISHGTVRKHVENIYKKLRVSNKIEAIQKARKSKII